MKPKTPLSGHRIDSKILVLFLVLSVATFALLWLAAGQPAMR